MSEQEILDAMAAGEKLRWTPVSNTDSTPVVSGERCLCLGSAVLDTDDEFVVIEMQRRGEIELIALEANVLEYVRS